MSNITVLDQSTINQIAAGEVIERPAAVVKELVENSIDAMANSITIEIKEGGISFIRITDNGSGISKEDISIAFLRHSTSKIKSIEDLLSVSSLGFRGEALSSIAAVARVELLTKIRGELNGIRYVIESGKEKTVEDVGCPEGTTFIVRDLFYHTPARRKFLKTPATETSYISDVIERLSMSHPDISFKFIVNNQIKLHTSGNGTTKDIIYNIYGREIASNLLLVEGKTEHIELSGFIGKPFVSRGNRNFMNYYINGRYIKSAVINKAIEEAYKPYTMTHRYPFTSLYFTIDSQFIDVNVHPTKMDVRFRNSDEIYNGVFHTLRNTLAKKEMIPDIILVEEEQKKEVLKNIPEPFEANRIKALKQPYHSPLKADTNTLEESSFLFKSTKNHIEEQIPLLEKEEQAEITKLNEIILNPLKYQKNDTKIESDLFLKEDSDYNINQESLFKEEKETPNYRILGQVFSTYWIVEYTDKMYLIDQHAAHEKVLYERFVKSLEVKDFLSQVLLPPIILSLNMREEETLKTHMDSLKQIGFEIESFGGSEYSIRAVPSDIFGIAAKELFIEIIDSLVDENLSKNPEIMLEKIASISCKGAVKGNQKLSFAEAETLIHELMTLENPYHCPHGRPTIVSMSKYEIEKKFKRIIS